MAFGVEELRVLRRALALALHPTPASAEDVKDCLRLAESLDEAMREGARLRAFLRADLARYRAALPGTSAGYLTLLEEALATGYRPHADDLAALHALRGNPAATTLLRRCQAATDQADPTASRAVSRAAFGAAFGAGTPTIPASRAPLVALPGGRAAADADQDPAKRPEKKPAEKPAAPKPGPGPAPAPDGPKPTRRPIPTPGEVFPRRKPSPPPTNPPQQLAAG
jgi:hypothetical protein